jgi:hypothetical protein
VNPLLLLPHKCYAGAYLSQLILLRAFTNKRLISSIELLAGFFFWKHVSLSWSGVGLSQKRFECSPNMRNLHERRDLNDYWQLYPESDSRSHSLCRRCFAEPFAPDLTPQNRSTPQFSSGLPIFYSPCTIITRRIWCRLVHTE